MVGERWQDETSVMLGDITVDKKLRKVFHDGVELILTPSEYALLDLLVTRKGQVFSHDVLIEDCMTLPAPSLETLSRLTSVVCEKSWEASARPVLSKHAEVSVTMLNNRNSIIYV